MFQVPRRMICVLNPKNKAFNTDVVPAITSEYRKVNNYAMKISSEKKKGVEE